MGITRIGFFGCGAVSRFHADVLRHLGRDIVAVASRPDSTRREAFRRAYDIRSSYDDWRTMLARETLDAVFVTASSDATDAQIVDLIATGVPLFVEKPVALSSRVLERCLDTAARHGQRVQVGYNRRFYEFVPWVRATAAASPPRAALVEIPEALGPCRPDTAAAWLNNPSHVLDLARHLLGEMTCIHLARSSTRDDRADDSFNGLLRAGTGVPVHLAANWNATGNWSIVLECRDRRVQLRPLESCDIFQGFDVVEPTPDRPMREYRPRLIDQRTCQAPDGRFKPGFLRQALHFLGIEDQTTFGFEPATLADALWVARFVENLLSRPAGAWSHDAP